MSTPAVLFEVRTTEPDVYGGNSGRWGPWHKASFYGTPLEPWASPRHRAPTISAVMAPDDAATFKLPPTCLLGFNQAEYRRVPVSVAGSHPELWGTVAGHALVEVYGPALREFWAELEFVVKGLWPDLDRVPAGTGRMGPLHEEYLRLFPDQFHAVIHRAARAQSRREAVQAKKDDYVRRCESVVRGAERDLQDAERKLEWAIAERT